MCSLVQLVDNKTLKIHEFPTLKFNNKSKENVLELARNLKIQHVISLFYIAESPCFLKKRR